MICRSAFFSVAPNADYMLPDADYLSAKTRQSAPGEYFCKTCDYTTSKTSDWKRHLKTKKHNATQMLPDADYLGAKTRPTSWSCDCGKNYAHKQSYYRHKAMCTYEPSGPGVKTQNEVVAQDKDQVILDLLKQNAEQQKVIIDLVQRAGNNNTISTNSHNTNINFYLNEHCKDAMSIQQFVKQLQIAIDNNPELLCSSKDTKPLLKVISNQLNTLEQKDRPLHSHKKTMYLKDEAAGWNPDKDGKAANTVIGAAKKAELNKLGSLYPRCLENEKDGEKYIQSMSELTRDVTEKERRAFEEMECLVLEVAE